MKDFVLFDLGNTLIQYYERSEFPAILRQSIAGVEDYLRREGFLNVSTGSVWQRVEEENYEATDHSVRPLEGRLSRIFQLDDPADETLMAMCRCFMEPVFDMAHRYEDVIPVLQELGTIGIKRAIVSNTSWGSPAELWREEIRRFDLDKHTELAVFCRDVGWRKPARQIFHYALEKLQASPQDCIFVGDDPRWDVVGPRTVGIETVLIDRRGVMHDAGTRSIESLYELLMMDSR